MKLLSLQYLSLSTSSVQNLSILVKFLLPDAEIPENVTQNFVGGDFTNDGAEVVDGFADVLGGEVCREAGGETLADAEEGSA